MQLTTSNSHLDLCGVGITSLYNRHREVLHEVGQRAEPAGKNKVQQRPQLFQVVLHRTSGQNYPVTCSKLKHPRNVLSNYTAATRSIQTYLYNTCVQFNCSSCVEQFANGSAVFWVTGHFLTPPENWTVRAFLQLTPRLSNDFTAAWLSFTFPQLFAVAATLKSITIMLLWHSFLIIIIIT